MSDERQHPEEEIEEADDAVIGVAVKWSLLVLFILAAVVAAILLATRESVVPEETVDREVVAPQVLNQEVAERPQVAFHEMVEAVDFQHFNGARGEKLLPEAMGSGVVCFDYDGDGLQDLLFTNGSAWPHDGPGGNHPAKLYRNRGGSFQDVTAASGLGATFYGMGAAVGDIDNDGDVDLYLTTLGENHLYRNDGGVFHDISAASGTAGAADAWSTSAGFFDSDDDGDLDLFVCNYVVWSREIDLALAFTLNGSDRAYGPPKQYAGTHNYLFRNDGDRFTDISAESGIQVVNPATGAAMGKALAVTFADLDRDGMLDILVANDTVQNFIFRNLGGGRFVEKGAEAGLAFDSMGAATGAMGMDAGNYANDDRIAVGIANFANESTSFYVQQPHDPWQFADMANGEGIGSPSRLKLSFGLFFFDYDLDGRLDMLQANGHLEDEINQIQPSQHYRQPAQLFWNTGGIRSSRFVMVPEDEVGDLSRPIVGRGAAYADLDGDGDLDVVLTQTGGAPLLLRNDQQLGHHWLRLKLVGKAANRDAIGATARLQAGGVTQQHTVMPTRSYLSQVELPLTFGLGTATKVDKLTITWPDGTSQQVTVNQLDTQLTITQL